MLQKKQKFQDLQNQTLNLTLADGEDVALVAPPSDDGCANDSSNGGKDDPSRGAQSLNDGQNFQYGLLPSMSDCFESGNPKEVKIAVSDEDWLAILKHPETPEDDWLRACEQLSQRPANDITSNKMERQRRRRKLVLASLASFAICALFTGSFAIFNSKSLQGQYQNISLKPSYIQIHAQWRNDELKERETVRLAQLLHKRNWSAQKAAQYFCVSNDAIGDLINGKRKNCFSIEQLNKMLFALGENPFFTEHIPAQEKMDAIDHYSRAIELDPNNQYAFWRRGDAYDKLGKFEPAQADMSRALELRPGRPWLIEKRALSYLRSRNFELALKDANCLVDKFPEANGEETRALVWQAMKQYDKALLDNNACIAKAPIVSPDAYANRALIYEKLGMFDSAVSDLETALKIDPNYTDADEALARLKNIRKS
jgi:tetratricopeptide (TPR) repeat protein